MQSALIHDRIRALAKEKGIKVLTFAEDVAASGGYMLALAGDEIYAHENSIVGSIGVVSAGFGFDKLIEKIGVERRVHTAGERKAMLDPFKPEDPRDAAHLEALQREVHESFKAMVRTRRDGKLKGDEKELFTGAFWTGAKAKELGLIDGLGDLRSICRAKFGDKVEFRVVTPRRSWFSLDALRQPRAGRTGLKRLGREPDRRHRRTCALVPLRAINAHGILLASCSARPRRARLFRDQGPHAPPARRTARSAPPRRPSAAARACRRKTWSNARPAAPMSRPANRRIAARRSVRIGELTLAVALFSFRRSLQSARTMSSAPDRSFQGLILTLQHYWAEQGCVLLQPYDMEMGAGTFHPATTLRALGPNPWKAAYVQPSRRPKDGRYGDNPNRFQRYYQFQVILKPSPDDVLDLYLGSLKALGISLRRTRHPLRRRRLGIARRWAPGVWAGKSGATAWR